MANAKWTIPFYTLQGRSAQVSIFDLTDPSYSGSATELVGAATPITIDDDDEPDLLQVLRAQSGYLNIVETDDTAAAIEALKPANNTCRRVELTIGNQLVWCGLMQAQSFDNAWVPSPRQMQFPVMSPLALTGDVDMPVYNPPARLMLCKLLSDAIGLLNDRGAGIELVVWPQETERLLTSPVSSLVVCPYNSDHDTTAQSPDLMKPDNVRYLIEAICNCFGWMVHDEPGKLVFTKFDGTGDYLEATPTDLGTYQNVTTATYTGETTLALTDYLTPADAQGTESILMPYEKIRLNYDGAVVKSANFDWQHLTYLSEDIYEVGGIQVQFIAYFKSETPELTGYSPDGWLRLTNQFNTANNRLKYEGVNPCVCGSVTTQNAGLLITHWSNWGSVSEPSQIVYDDHLFTVTFYERPTSDSFFVKFDQMWGGFLMEMNSDENHDRPRVGLRLKCGDKWYHGNGTWNTTRPTYHEYSFGKVTSCPFGDPIEVQFYDASNQTQPQGLTQWDIYNLISDIRLETVDAVFTEYKIVDKGYTELKIGEGDGRNVADIYLGVNAYYKNSNLIGTLILWDQDDWFTLYHYMLYSREQLVIRCRRSALQPALPYYAKCAQVSFAGKVWRLISTSRDPWNDIVTVQLQRSLEPTEEE